ncbi:Protein artichoke [Dirofilaria immitis]
MIWVPFFFQLLRYATVSYLYKFLRVVVKLRQMHSSKLYRWMRFILRRKQCLYITGILSSIAAFLTLLFFSAFHFYNSSVRELHLVRQENKFLPQYANRINFFHCSYNFSTEADIEQCNGCGNASFVHLSMRLLNRFDLTCVDLSHRAKCFDQNVKCNSLASLPYEQCEGLRGIPVRESEGVSTDSFVKVLTANITELMNRTVVSQQIVALCPRCHFFGRPYYSSMDTCVQKLHTMRTGWPRQFQWCDWYQPSDKCV